MTIILFALLALTLLAVALILAGRRPLGKREMAAGGTQGNELEDLGRKAVERARNDIERVGWHLLMVQGTEQGAGFVYTIGLWRTYQHPELVVFAPSQDPQDIEPQLRAMADRIAKGETFRAGTPYAGLFGTFRGSLRPVLPQWFASYLGTAGACYETFDFPALQVFWPDRQGRFPWESSYDVNLFRFQPILSEANVVLAGVGLAAIGHVEAMNDRRLLPASLAEMFAAEEVPGDEVLEDWHWLVGPQQSLFRVTLFGDLFLKSPEGRISWLDAGSAHYEEIAGSEEEWTAMVCALPAVFFHASTLLQLRELDWKPAAGQVYSRQQPFFLGGQETVDNIDLVSTVVHISHTGRVAHAVRDIPEGTRITGFQVPPILPR
ncbi:MAG TPA: DUF4262 domain-containing protein [Thermoanaerobaculia bacterium]|nr:DUF4262 domain-containing protein [Thermoanaerobaculia bacterium]